MNIYDQNFYDEKGAHGCNISEKRRMSELVSSSNKLNQPNFKQTFTKMVPKIQGLLGQFGKAIGVGGHSVR